MKTKLFVALTLLFAVFMSGCESAGEPANTSSNNTSTEVEQPEVSEITEAEVTTALKALSTAVGSNDAAALEKMYADDYHMVTSTGAVQTKAERLESMKSGAVKYQSVEFINPKTRIYGNNAIVVTNSAGKLTAEGKEMESNFVATIIFVKSKDDLKVVSSQLTDKAKQ